MTNHDLKEIYFNQELVFIDREKHLKNIYFGSKIRQSYLRSFPKIPKEFVKFASVQTMFPMIYDSSYGKFISSLVYPKHLQYSDDFLYRSNFAEKLYGTKLGYFNKVLRSVAMHTYAKMTRFDIDDYSFEEMNSVFNRTYKSSMYLKKELLRKIFLFTLEGYLSETNIHIDFETYDKWPINKIKLTQEYKNSGKLCKEFFHSI